MEDDSRSGNPAAASTPETQDVQKKSKKKNPNPNQARKKSSARSGKASNSLSFLESFKNEWALFWAGINGDSETEDSLLPEKVEALEPNQIKEITKNLSEQKKRLNQKLESIAKEMDLNMAKLQSLKLSGVDSPDTEKRVSELSDLGHQINTEIGKIDERLKMVRVQDRAAQKLVAAL